MPGNERIAMKYFGPPKFRPYPTKKYLMGYVDVARDTENFTFATVFVTRNAIYIKFVSTRPKIAKQTILIIC